MFGNNGNDDGNNHGVINTQGPQHKDRRELCVCSVCVCVCGGGGGVGWGGWCVVGGGGGVVWGVR